MVHICVEEYGHKSIIAELMRLYCLFIQLLQHFEHLVSPLATLVHICVEEYGHKSIVAELMRYTV